MSEPKTVKRIVKHIPYGEFYPRNLAVTLPSISFLEKPPLWETEWWREQAAKSQLSRMREMSNKKINLEVFAPGTSQEEYLPLFYAQQSFTEVGEFYAATRKPMPLLRSGHKPASVVCIF